MVAIVNITPEDKLDGKVHNYEVRINRKVITHFDHVRVEGLAVCLEKAAEAVRVQKNEDDLHLLLSLMPSDQESGLSRDYITGDSS